MVARVRDYDLEGLVARGTLVVAPLLAFSVFPVRGAFSVAMVVPMVILAAGFFRRPLRRVPVWEIVLVGLLTLSIVWGDEPDYSESRLHGAVPILVSTILAASLLPRRTVLKCLQVALAVMILSAVVLIVIDPSARSADGYSGLAVHGQYAKNAFGGIVGFALVLAICSGRKNVFLVVAPLVVLLGLNQSSTALIVTTVVVTAVGVLRLVARRQGTANVSTLLWLALSGAALTVLVVLVSDTLFLSLLGKDPTLSSRTDIWAACWTEIKNAPLLGHGAFTFLEADSGSPVTLRIWSEFTTYYLPPHPHNGLLDVWGQLGLVGVAAFAGFAMTIVRAGIRGARLADRTSLTALAAFVYILLFGISEPTYLGNWLVVSFMCAAAADPAHIVRRRTVVDGDHVADTGSAVVSGSKGGRHRSAPAKVLVGTSA